MANKPKNAAVSILPTLLPELRTPSVLTGLANGSLLNQLEAEGRILVAPDGTIALP